MRKTFLLSVALVVVGIAVAGCSKSTRSGLESDSSQSDEKNLYELKLSEGLSYDVRVTTDIEYHRLDGKLYSSEQSIGFGYRFDVNSIDYDGNAMVDCKVTWVKYKQRISGGIPENQDVDYDSSDKKRQTIPKGEDFEDLSYYYARFVRAFLDEKFTILMTPFGEAKEVMELDMLRKNLGRKYKGFQKATDTLLTSTLNTFFLSPLLVYPEEPVGIGDSWAVTGTEIFPFEFEKIFTLKDRKGGKATIEAESDFTIPIPAKDGEISEKPGRYQGQIKINESTGQILVSKVNLDFPSQGGNAKKVITFEMTKP